MQPEKQNRDTNQFQRFEKRPTPVHKLGHYGMCVTNFKKCYEFYSKYFNFYPSEVSKFPIISPGRGRSVANNRQNSSTTTTKTRT